MFRKALIILGVFSIICSGTSFAQELKVAIIDVNKVLNDSKEGTDAKNKMKVKYDELQVRLSKKQEELKNLKDEIEKQKIILGKEKVKEKEDALEKEMAEFRKIVGESEKEMRDTESAYTQTILKEIKTIVEKLVKEKGISLVLDRSGGVVHSDEGLDITDEVIEILNKEYESAGNKSE